MPPAFLHTPDAKSMNRSDATAIEAKDAVVVACVQVRLDFEAANLDLFNANFRACPHVTTMFPSPTSNCPTGRSH
eukprot:3071807-Rhodomonas_salina.1